MLRIVSRIAGRIGLVDDPGGRKSHERPVPLAGGIAMFVAFSLSVLLLDVPLSPYRFLFAGALILVVVGLLDDLRELSPGQRIWAQILAAVLMAVGGGVVLEDLGNLFSPDSVLTLGVLALPVTVFSSVGVVNALNMSDGLDGLAGSLALVTLGALGVLAWSVEAYRIAGVLCLLAVVLLPFLALNLRLKGQALVYMGDTGSMFLGFVLAWLLIQFSQGEERLMAPVTGLWVFLVPLVDAVTVMVRRLLLGRSPFQGDREHCHHLLLAAGFTAKQTLTLMIVLALLGASVGVAAEVYAVRESWMFGAFLAVFGLHFWATMRATRKGRLLERQAIESAPAPDRLQAASEDPQAASQKMV
jgi:UDP-GlcNAc:undecaprenyl-phosphate GlcNAc-1-phosphate transferase